MHAALSPLRTPFSVFPGGSAGLALVLLRVSASLASLLSAYGSVHDPASWHWWALIPLVMALCAGVFTRFVAPLIIAIQLLGFRAMGIEAAWFVVSLLDVLALSLIGPGAYSLDALRFGRRLLMSDRRD
jgi:putative oxidoreductase